MEEAIPYVNDVRNRVGAQALNSNDYTTVKGLDDMRQRIRKERYWELAFEEYMFFDELRWGTWKEKKFYEGNGLMEAWGNTTYLICGVVIIFGNGRYLLRRWKRTQI